MIEFAVTPEPVTVWPTAQVPVRLPPTVRTVPEIVQAEPVASVGSEAVRPVWISDAALL